MLTQAAALELAPYQIRVNGIAPGTTDTESNQPYKEQDPDGWNQVIKKIPLGRAGKPNDIAGLAVFLAWMGQVGLRVSPFRLMVEQSLVGNRWSD